MELACTVRSRGKRERGRKGEEERERESSGLCTLDRVDGLNELD